jgi:hypothetical protein
MHTDFSRVKTGARPRSLDQPPPAADGKGVEKSGFDPRFIRG